MTGIVLLFLMVFYAGAVLTSALSWSAAWRGALSYSALRDLTGIRDRTELRRLFGLTRGDGRYPATVAAVLRHRRPTGVLLTDLPVHILLLAATTWGFANQSLPAATAIGWVATANAAILMLAALSVLAGRPRERRVGS